MAARAAVHRIDDFGVRSRPERRKPNHGGALFAAGACAACFIGIFWFLRAVPAPRPAPPPSPPSPWLRIVDPIPLYDLPSPMLGPDQPSYQAWRARSGQGRRDLLAFGDFGKDAPYLEIAILQSPPAKQPQPFFAALARQAAFLGFAVLRSAVPDGIGTRFGLMSVSDSIVSGGARSRACLGFRVLASAVRMTGLACGSQQRPMTRADLVCALDRLDLIGGSGESPTTLFFERSELARGDGCPADAFAPSGHRESLARFGSLASRLPGRANGEAPPASADQIRKALTRPQTKFNLKH